MKRNKLTQEQYNVANIIAKQVKIENNKHRKCFKCNSNAINSHVLGKTGILKPLSISAGGKLMELNLQKNARLKSMRFKPTHIASILTFKGFCNPCDNQIFLPIENRNADYNILGNQILLSLRGVYFEKRKKEISIDTYKNLIKNNSLPLEVYMKYWRDMIEIQSGINDLNYLINDLENELLEAKGRFIFKTYLLDEIPFVASSVFSTESKNSLNNLEISEYLETKLNNIIFNLFPFRGKSMLVIGFSSTNLKNLKIIERFESYDKREKLNFISNILIERIESWACSVNFYKRHIKKNEKIIITDFLREPRDFDGRLSNSYNLFKNWQLN